MLKPAGRRAKVKTEKNSQGEGEGRQNHGYHEDNLSLGPLLTGFYQTHTTVITETLSYIKSTKRIIYSYLSSWNNLQTLVGTRYWVLRTQVFLVILKQKKCAEIKPALLPKAPCMASECVYICPFGDLCYVAYPL